MGLFNFNKPGPGVSKNAPKKKGIFLYFEIFKRKLSKLFSLNLLYFFCSLPMLILYFLIFLYIQNVFLPTTLQMDGLDITKLHILLALFLSICSLLLLGSGPASASMAYVLREYSKEEHVWLMSTFFEKMKENFKQEMTVAIIDLLFVFLSTFALGFYATQYLKTGQTMWFALILLVVVFSIIFTLMHFFIHQLIVTFNNKLKDIYKNALLITCSKLFGSIALAIMVVGVSFAIYIYLNPVFALALTMFMLITFLRFPVEFYVQRAIKKIILNNTDNTEVIEEEEPVFSDVHGSEE